MVSISKYRDTTWYRYRTFKVLKYSLIISLYLEIDTYFGIWIIYADFQIYTIVLTYRIWTYNASIEYRVSNTILVSSGIEAIIVSSQL